MKIKRDEINKFKKLLEKIPYIPMNGNKSTIFFEIETEKVVDDGSFIFTEKDTNTGSAALVRPGLALFMEKDEKEKIHTKVNLVYAQTAYCPKFNVPMYLDIIGKNFGKNDLLTLTELETLLVSNDYILAILDI